MAGKMCIIEIIGKKQTITLYRFGDGTPEFTGLDLMKRFAFRLGYGLTFDIVLNELIKDVDGGYTVNKYINRNTKYLYRIDLTEKKILCFEVEWVQNYGLNCIREIKLLPIFRESK